MEDLYTIRHDEAELYGIYGDADNFSIMSDAELLAAVQVGIAKQRPVLRAAIFLSTSDATFSEPANFMCEGGIEALVKPPWVTVQHGRACCTEQIVARLGLAMAAPVVEPLLIDVSPTLIEMQPELRHWQPGLAHGTRIIPNLSQPYRRIAHADEQLNRERHARLAVLLAWTFSGDVQFFYSIKPPPLVHSIDHGMFLPDGEHWCSEALARSLNDSLSPMQTIVDEVGLLRGDLVNATQQLQAVTDDAIVDAVCAPPEAWGVNVQERMDLYRFFAHRRNRLLESVA